MIEFDKLVKLLSTMKLDRAGIVEDNSVRVQCLLNMSQDEFSEFRELFSKDKGHEVKLEIW